MIWAPNGMEGVNITVPPYSECALGGEGVCWGADVGGCQAMVQLQGFLGAHHSLGVPLLVGWRQNLQIGEPDKGPC